MFNDVSILAETIILGIVEELPYGPSQNTVDGQHRRETT